MLQVKRLPADEEFGPKSKDYFMWPLLRYISKNLLYTFFFFSDVVNLSPRQPVQNMVLMFQQRQRNPQCLGYSSSFTAQ